MFRRLLEVEHHSEAGTDESQTSDKPPGARSARKGADVVQDDEQRADSEETKHDPYIDLARLGFDFLLRSPGILAYRFTSVILGPRHDQGH